MERNRRRIGDRGVVNTDDFAETYWLRSYWIEIYGSQVSKRQLARLPDGLAFHIKNNPALVRKGP